MTPELALYMPAISVLISTSAARRLDAARRFLDGLSPTDEATLVGASREAADELVRARSIARRATVGLHRFSFLQLAARAASLDLARAGRAAATRLGAEAVAARVTFDARAGRRLRYFDPVAGFRGFPRALAATVSDLRLGHVDPAAVAACGDAGHDLGALAAAFDAELAAAGLADRAALLDTAARAVGDGRAGLSVDRPLLLLDVPIDSTGAASLVAALAACAPIVVATVPAGDERTIAALSAMPGADVRALDDGDDEGDDGLSRLRRRLFQMDDNGRAQSGAGLRQAQATPSLSRGGRSALGAGDDPAGSVGAGVSRPDDDRRVTPGGPESRVPDPESRSVFFFSAPGEGREAVEIARRVLEEAARGVRFDDMAIVLRAPGVYAALVETALRRAGVGAWFARGTATPHPAGRAFLAVLACAAEGLSARRFAEYLSLGQVPVAGDTGGPPPVEPPWVAADTDEQPLPAPAEAALDAAPGGQLSLFDAVGSVTADRPEARSLEPEAVRDADHVPVLDGTLRAPWKWEHLLVESAVVGGGRARWERRLDGLRRELELKRDEARREEHDSPRARRFERELTDLGHLERFALPVIDALVALPGRASWGGWLDALDRLAPMVLRRPERVLATLAELRPMAAVGPVTLEEVRHVLAERLSTLSEAPPRHRYGRVFVGGPDQLRGRRFTVVFVPGLAERIFPQRPRQDPLLLDELRRALDGDGTRDSGSGPASRSPAPGAVSIALPLSTRDDQSAAERALLRLAAGAASARLYLSYPRMELGESRPRVPSFYALDVERALTGRVPDFKELEDQAYVEAAARLAWPAPPDPARAIDDTEHDLAVLGRLLRLDRRADARGRARYLFELDPTLRRSLLQRFARWQKKWSSSDGLYKPGAEVLAALAKHRLSARAYSVSALQKFAVCPYQFLLSAIFRLEPRKTIEPLEKMDPLTRGSIFHRVQAELMRALEAEGRLPVVAAGLADARRALDRTLDRVAAEEKETLAPAIDRVWRDEIEAMRADLRGWLQRVADEGGEWTPIHAELGFGFPPGEGRDPASVAEPAVLDGRWRLHGFVDLVEAGGRGPEAGDRVTADGASRLKPRAPSLRVTDHKTGRARAKEGFIVGGGEMLQPVLYGMAVEQALGAPVVSSRLFYCTAAGGFTERAVSLGPMERRHGLEVLEIVDRAVEAGFLPPVPREGACQWCDFREVCGPSEELRAGRKPSVPPLEELRELRRLP